ncbi:MAG: hypothetical protein ACRECC_07540 [Pseudolabrys sp.]|jgi:translation initiation factor 1 (eIF-1/SUI1)
MTHRLVHTTVVERPRKVIHVVRILDEILEIDEIDQIAERMRQRALSRHGEQSADVVVIQGDSKETLRLFGDSHPVNRVRAAMFNAALSFTPIELE